MAVKKTASKRAAKKTASKKTAAGKKKNASKKSAAGKKGVPKKLSTKQMRMEMMRQTTITESSVDLRAAAYAQIFAAAHAKYKPTTTGRIVKSSPIASRLGDDRIEAAVRAVVERHSGKG